MQGLQYTLLITFVGVFFGFIIGAIFGLMRISNNKLVYGIATVYVEIVRGTPLLAQIFFLYFGLPELLGVNLDKLTASILAIALTLEPTLLKLYEGLFNL